METALAGHPATKTLGHGTITANNDVSRQREPRSEKNTTDFSQWISLPKTGNLHRIHRSLELHWIGLGGKSTGKPYCWWKPTGFSVEVPFNQSSEDGKMMEEF